MPAMVEEELGDEARGSCAIGVPGDLERAEQRRVSRGVPPKSTDL
jgi:hypothetical protein